MLVLCRQTTELITDEREHALPPLRRLAVRFHLAVCPHCRTYARQLDTTVDALSKLPADEVKPPDMDVLLSELRNRPRTG